jgi:hypothetical protein
MDCGVVLDENLLGGEEYLGPGIIRERGGGKETLCHRSTAAKREEWEGGERGEDRKRENFSHLIQIPFGHTRSRGESVG